MFFEVTRRVFESRERFPLSCRFCYNEFSSYLNNGYALVKFICEMLDCGEEILSYFKFFSSLNFHKKIEWNYVENDLWSTFNSRIRKGNAALNKHKFVFKLSRTLSSILKLHHKLYGWWI